MPPSPTTAMRCMRARILAESRPAAEAFLVEERLPLRRLKARAGARSITTDSPSSAPMQRRSQVAGDSVGRLAPLLVVALSLSACRSPLAPRVLTVAHEAQWASLDPLTPDAVGMSVLGNFYEGLVDFDQDMKIEPRLAV